MSQYRLTDAAQADIISILTWSHEHFGERARRRYEALIATAIRDVAADAEGPGPTPRPELGKGALSWHLARSRDRSPGGRVRHPRHVLICRRDGPTLVIGRVLHESMDLKRHIAPWRNDDTE